MTKLLAACALALLCCTACAQANPDASAPPAPVAASQAAAALPLDPVAATRKFMDRVQGEARVKSDAYSEGGYWLLLWDLLYGLAVAWLLLSRRMSTRIRDFAERRTPSKNLQRTHLCARLCTADGAVDVADDVSTRVSSASTNTDSPISRSCIGWGKRASAWASEW